MKASDYIANRIAEQGVRYVFGYQGGNIAHTIDSIGKHPDIEFVSTYNEQGAAFSACGYALENETIGVALASSGPGAINLISGIANAYYDSIPCLFLTGNVSTSTMKQKNEIRQNAFQENDIVSMVSKVTKYAVTVMDVHDLKYHLEKALYLAKEGRPGPVLIDLPHNIQKADTRFEEECGFCSIPQEFEIKSNTMESIIDIISKSLRPLIIVGGGVQSEKSKSLLDKLLNKWNIPVVSTLRGLDVVSHKKNNFVGFGGAYGNRGANYAIKYSDLLLVLGARLDERFICVANKDVFLKKKIIHIDVDPVELGRVFSYEIQIMEKVDSFLKKILEKDIPVLNYVKWINVIRKWNERFPSVENKWTINKAVYELTSNAKEDAIISLDIGINQMCAAQSLNLNGKKHCYTSAGHGAMGCALPIAIGAVYAKKNKVCDCYVGDGALHMNIQELLMLSRDGLPVHVILNNNKCLGMIRDFQTKAFASRFVATVEELQDVNYKDIAKAYKLNYCMVDSIERLDNAIDLIQKQEPCFIELVFPEDTDSNPKLGIDMFRQLPLLQVDDYLKMEQEVLSCGNIISW